MIYKKVDKIEEKISVIGMGCWNFGGEWDHTDDKNSEKIIDAAIENGVNFFDVAPVYGFGHSEKILGQALKKNGKRNQILIASKGGLIWNDAREITNNLSKESLLKEIDDSLSRMQVDHIDLYQLHWPDHSVSLEETAQALKIMLKAGKIRYVGLSNYSLSGVKKMMDMVDVNCQQGLYNMLERNSTSYHGIALEYLTEKEILPLVKENGQAYLPYSPLFQGLLSGRFKNKENFSTKDIRNANPKLVEPMFQKYYDASMKLKEIADEYGKPLYELAYNWLRKNPQVTSIIGGVSSIEQLEKNINSTTWNIDDQMMEKINEVIDPFENL